MGRREYKYIVSSDRLEALRAMILPHVDLDMHAAAQPRGEYTVRSLYLDTIRMKFYHDKIAGLPKRLKLRLRGYNDIAAWSPVYLEIKRKDGSSVTKNRSALQAKDVLRCFNGEDIGELLLSAMDPEKSFENARKFFYQVHTLGLRPVICVDYEREPYFSRIDSGVRLTLDKNLRVRRAVTLNALTTRAPTVEVLPGRFVLEVKTDSRIPLWVQMILSRLDVVREAVSKYALGVESLAIADLPLHSLRA